ncbi:putative ATP-dependent helicase C23E6.02 [Hypsizygus marmoreus]|uniref:ATP-dependent helicase C23E6.02 n=1 Tax=Hypsizygus marmoreus TaxID=39966 RepID=A0A369JTV6_HYPMA|nr:putative ATP-dependent helicase C23E6.02 [Hypsizygus marmoreus]
MRNLLPRLTQNVDNWNGVGPFDPSPSLVPNNKDRRTLAEIYGDLKSPQAKVTPGWEDITSRLLDFEDDLGGLGMRSSLHTYQRRSVTAMIQKELDMSDVPDPLFIPLSSMMQETFYLQPGTMEILRERPTVAASRSGILCEELGTGKTVMILALILATIHQISSPEESIVDERPVLTPLSFRHFPSYECVAARKRLTFRIDDNTIVQGPRVPSLVELLLHRRRTTPDTRIPNTTIPSEATKEQRKSEVAALVEQIRPGELLRANTPFYLHYHGEPRSNERNQRNNADPGPRVVHLTSATLIIVPANLLSQWDREIQKHCEYPLRVLILRSGTPMPHVISLASDYDIILMTYKRFTIENTFNKKEKLHTWNVCRCPEFSEARIPNCTCTVPGVSPLLQIRWKRLVIDEGHVSASLSTILTPFTKLLSVERRWIVTGTPTTNLLGLSLGKHSTEQQEVSEGKEDYFDTCDAEEKSVDMSNPPSQSDSPEPANDDDAPSRIWSKDDREDLRKLGKMITHFLSVPQFSGNTKLVSTHIIDPLLDQCGPRTGAIQILNQVMEMIMIRHRIEDVEDDVVLPPVKQESILLDLDPYAVKSYNAMQAAVAINAVDSQRTDQDYMFHPRNVDYLQLTVKNMSQVMFWSTDDALYNVDELAKNAQEHINIAIERKMPPEDLALLNEAFKHVKIAAQDPLWRAIQGHEDVPYRVYNMRRTIFDAWTRTPHLEPSYNTDLVGFLQADRLLKMQDEIIRRPRISEENFMESGALVAAHDSLRRQIFKDSQKAKDKRSGRKSIKHHEETNATMKTEDAAKKVKEVKTLKEMQRDLHATMARLNDCETEEHEHQPNPIHSSEFHGGSLLATSLLGQVRLGSTASSKLNYIINEVLQYSSDEKFLIFSDSELSLAHVAEALELMHVKFLRFTTHIESRLREQMVLTFETSETYRVLLMELKHGARGLNLISASRVIFCEPVWQADVESQAIKRAHRIGQTRPITVKTLAIRGTAEENMVARRSILQSTREKVPKLIEEAGMRHYIANPKFINHAPERYSTINMPLLKIVPEDCSVVRTELASSPSRKRVRPVDPISPAPVDPGTGDAESPKKKKRAVRFE